MHPISVARGLPTKPTARNAALTASHDMLVSSGVRDIFLASLLADWARKAALHPVDTLTARLQYDRTKASPGTVASRVPFMNDAKLAFGIVSRPGAASELYRGLGTSLMGAVPMALVYMPTYEIVSTTIRGVELPLPASQLASVATGVACASVRVPVTLIKQRVQLGLFKTPALAIRAALQSGLAGLYVGLSATVGLDVTYAIIQFTALEYFRRLGLLLSGGRVLSSMEDALVGFLTGAVTAVLTEPLDVVRTRLQTQRRPAAGVGGTDFGYTGLLDGLVKASRQEGALVLWRGLLPRLVLKSCGSCIWYSVYMAVLRALG